MGVESVHEVGQLVFGQRLFEVSVVIAVLEVIDSQLLELALQHRELLVAERVPQGQ